MSLRSYPLWKSTILLCLCTLFLSACFGGRSNIRENARNQFVQGQLAEAEASLLNPELVADSKNRLLTLFELGTIAHYQGLFEKSNKFLFRAKAVARDLYTKSIREQIATGLINDNAASYTGMPYEISLMHYYIALNFLFLSQSSLIPAWEITEIREGSNVLFPAHKQAERSLNPNDQARFLQQARSELLDWNAFLQEVRQASKGKPYYKDDLLNKVVAAYIHRMVDKQRDKNIAQILYKDASRVLLKAYSAYPTYNQNSEAFVDNYTKFSRYKESTIKKRYVQETPFFQATSAQIQNSRKQMKNTKPSIYYLLEFGTIPQLTERRYVIGLSTIFGEIKDPQLRRSLEELSTHLILQLAPEFGLTVVGAAVVGGAVGSRQGKPQYISEAVDSVLGFEFYLPSIPEDPTRYAFRLQFRDTDKNTEFSAPVGVLSPLNDIARLNIDRRAGAVAFKTGVRVGLKYLAALIPAIYTYQKIEGAKMLKMFAASAVWAGGKKIVDSSERADIRAWNFLPKWIGGVEVQLPPGNYEVTAVANDPKGEQSIPLGRILVEAKQRYRVHKSRIFSSELASSPVVNIIN